jgi:hypothetical protein
MQASQIKFGDDYAVMYKGEPRAMRASAIKTVRTREDVINYIEGPLLDAVGEGVPNPEGNGPVWLSYKVKDVLGPFAEQMAMVNARLKSVEAKAAADKADMELAEDLMRKLYDRSGLPMPNDYPNRYDHPFSRDTYRPELVINIEGIRRLMKLLTQKEIA